MSAYFASIDKGVRVLLHVTAGKCYAAAHVEQRCQGSGIKRYNGTMYSTTVERKLRKAKYIIAISSSLI